MNKTSPKLSKSTRYKYLKGPWYHHSRKPINKLYSVYPDKHIKPYALWFVRNNEWLGFWKGEKIKSDKVYEFWPNAYVLDKFNKSRILILPRSYKQIKLFLDRYCDEYFDWDALMDKYDGVYIPNIKDKRLLETNCGYTFLAVDVDSLAIWNTKGIKISEVETYDEY